jgi:hypothetical protein
MADETNDARLIGHMTELISDLKAEIERLKHPTELTDEQVERAVNYFWRTASQAPLNQKDYDEMRATLLAAGPWTRKPDREKMIEALVKNQDEWAVGDVYVREDAERVVDVLLEAKDG